MPRRLLPLFVVFLLPAQESWRDWLNRGVQAFKAAQYSEAIEAFQKAVSLDPAQIPPHLYLATAWMQQYIPGIESADNSEMARRAEEEFGRVLQLEPANFVALKSLATIAFNRRRFDDVKKWEEKVLAADPRNKEAYYTLGVVAWQQSYESSRAARERLGMRPEEPGPLRDPNVRQEAKIRNGAGIEEGMAQLTKALELDPSYGDAMAYLNLLLRLRAELRDTPEEYAQDIAAADTWVQKALEIKRQKAGAGTAISAGIPPPPPPPPGVQRIRVGGGVQEHKLVQQTAPVYPPLARQARIQEVVRMNVVIGKDGRVINVTLLSGHPLLVPPRSKPSSSGFISPRC